LGHLYPPYEDDDPDGPERDSGVLLWQENLWRDIVTAALRGDAQAIPFAAHDRLQLPAASRYSATTPTILSWFRQHLHNNSMLQLTGKFFIREYFSISH
jgi:hypothetical protein